MEQVYNALTGEEMMLKVLSEIKKHLQEDGNFRRASTYHKLEWTWKISFKAFGRPTQEATVQGDVTAQTDEAKISLLQSSLQQVQQAHKLELQSIREKHSAELNEARQQFEKQLADLRAVTDITVVSKVQDALEESASREYPEDSSGAVEFEVSAEQAPIEEPDRIREDLEIGAGLENVTVGNEPSEARVTDSTGAVAPAPRAGRGAIVGRGQRPANVVGRPRG
jgi:hypothetical protein